MNCVDQVRSQPERARFLVSLRSMLDGSGPLLNRLKRDMGRRIATPRALPASLDPR